MKILDSSNLKEFADDNFEFEKNGEKLSKKGRKYCVKTRHCLLRAIFPFPTVFSKNFTEGTKKNQGLFAKGLSFSTIYTHFNTLKKKL